MILASDKYGQSKFPTVYYIKFNRLVGHNYIFSKYLSCSFFRTKYSVDSIKRTVHLAFHGLFFY